MFLLISAALAAEPRVVPLPWPYASSIDWAGDTIAVAGYGGAAFFGGDGALRATYKSRAGIYTVQLSDDGHRALIQLFNGDTRLLDDDGNVLESWRSDRWEQPGAALSPSGDSILWTSYTGATIRALDGAERPLPGLVGSSSEIGFLSEDLVYGRGEDAALLRLHTDRQSAMEPVPVMGGFGGQATAAGDVVFVHSWQSGQFQRIQGAASSFFVLPGQAGDAFAADPRGERVAYAARGAGGMGVALTILDPTTGQLWRPEVDLFASIDALAWSPDGGTLAVLEGPQLWLVAAPGSPDPRPPRGEAIDLLGFTADGEAAWALYASGELWSWNLESGAATRTGRVNLDPGGWQGPPRARLPGSDGVVALGSGGAVRRYGLDGAPSGTLLAHVSDTLTLSAAPDGTVAMAGAGWLLLADPSGQVGDPLPLTQGAIFAVAPGGAAVALQGWTGETVVLDPATATVLARIKNQAIDLRFLTDGTLVHTSAEGLVTLWSPAQDAASKAPAMLVVGSVPGTTLADSYGSRLLITGSEGDLVLRDVATGQWRGDVVHGWPWEYQLGYVALALHPNGRQALTANRFGAIQLWDLEERALLATLEGPLPAALAVAAGADGRLYGAWADRGVGPLDAPDSSALKKVGSDALDLAVSPDGRSLALARSDGSVALVRADSGEVVWTADAFEYVARAVLFSADGDRVYARDDGGALVTLDAATGQAASEAVSGAYGFGELDGALWIWTGAELGVQRQGEWTAYGVGRRSWRMSSLGLPCADAFIVGSGYGDNTAFYRIDRPGKRPKPFETDWPTVATALACVGEDVAIADASGTLSVFNARSGAFVARFEAGGPVADLAPVGADQLAVALLDGRVRVFDRRGAPLRAIALSDAPRPDPPDPMLESPQESP